MPRIGVLGNGQIAGAVVDFALTTPGYDLAFVRSRSAGTAPRDIPVTLLPPSGEELSRVDLVAEAAHPDVVAEHGERVLRHCDLLVVSSGALVDEALLDRLTRTATQAGTRLIIPQGALVGLDAVRAQAQRWDEASITMVKAPAHLDPAPEGITERTVLHDGAIAPLAHRYPRNVNAMVTFALATRGTRHTRCRLVCDPDAELGRIDIQLTAVDGTTLHIVKEQPMVGVSGSEMPDSILRTLATVTGAHAPGLSFA